MAGTFTLTGKFVQSDGVTPRAGSSLTISTVPYPDTADDAVYSGTKTVTTDVNGQISVSLVTETGLYYRLLSGDDLITPNPLTFLAPSAGSTVNVADLAVFDAAGVTPTVADQAATSAASAAASAASAALSSQQRFRPLRAACIGTSIYANGLRTAKDEIVTSGSGWSATNMDRYMQNPGGQSWFTWMCLLSGGRMLHHYNGAESSSDSTSWAARVTSQIIPKKPDLLFFGDATNDINNGLTDAVIRANVATLVSLAVAANITPVLVSTTVNSDATKNIRIRLHNEWLMRYAWANGLYFIDPFQAIVDPASTTGFPLAGNTSDGLHPNETGAKAVGQRAVDQLAGLLRGPVSPSAIPWVAQNRVNGASNLLLNPLFQDDVNVDSNADNWSVSAGGGRTLVTDARVIGKLQGFTVNGANQSIARDTSVDTTNIATGDRMALSGLIEVTNTSSLQWYVGLTCLGQAGNWTSRAIGYAGGGPVGVSLGLAPFYCELTVPTGATIVRSHLLALSGTGTLAAAQWRLVNLTKNGLDALF